ncbi:MAG: ABC transporter ATP-binding protein [Bdellovibrionales bacterium]|nr:ABC transporter ATP-binding protein [Bdellovibrionales bacterium]
MITVQNLSRNYGDFVAVNGVSFEIPRGSVVGLLGHNGAGKTTIMKMLTGYLEPTKGVARIDGQDITSDRVSAQRKIGYLPENSPTYPEMTVVDYLEYVAELRDIPKSQQGDAIKKAIQRTRLQEKAVDFINTLSRGYRQRVGVAQAVLHEPDILILDEPTNGLDPNQIQEMRQLIRDLSERSTVILSTHILQEVSAVCDRVLILSRGKLVLDSSLDDLSTRNNFILETDASLETVRESLKDVSTVDSVDTLGTLNGTGPMRSSYRLHLKKEDLAAAADITKKLIEKGTNLYSFKPEERNLESIFREVSA